MSYTKMKIFTEDEKENPPKLEINFVEISSDGEVAICFVRRNDENYVYYCVNFNEEEKTWYKEKDNTVVNYNSSDFKFRDTTGCTTQTDDLTIFNIYFISTQQCKTDWENNTTHDKKIYGELLYIYYYQFQKNSKYKFNGLQKIYCDSYELYYIPYAEYNGRKYEYYSINCSTDNNAIFLGATSGVIYIDLIGTTKIYAPYLEIGESELVDPKKVSCLSSNLSGVFQNNNKLYYGHYEEYIQDGKTYYFQFYGIQSDLKFYNVSQIIYNNELNMNVFYGNVLEPNKTYDSLFMFEYPPKINKNGDYALKSTKIYSDYGWNDYSQINAILNLDGSNVLGMCGAFGLIYNYNKSTENFYNCSKFGYKMDRCSITNIDNGIFTMISCKDNNNLYVIDTQVPPLNIPTIEFDKHKANTTNNEISNLTLCETAIDGNFIISYGRYNGVNYIYTYNGTVDAWIRSNASYDNNYSYMASSSFTYPDSLNGETLRAYFITENSSATYISYYSIYGSILQNNDTTITRYQINIRDVNGNVIEGVEGYKSLNINTTGTAMAIGGKFRFILTVGDTETRQLTQSNQSYITSYCTAKNEGLYVSSVACSEKYTTQGLFVNTHDGKSNVYNYYRKKSSDPTIYYGKNSTIGVNGEYLTNNCYKISNITISSQGSELFFCVRKDEEGLFYIQLIKVIFNKNETSIEIITDFKYNYNWNLSNIRMYDKYNFCAAGTKINDVNLGIVCSIDGNTKEYIKSGKQQTHCSISNNLNSDIYMFSCANNDVIYNYNTNISSTTMTTLNVNNLISDEDVINPNKSKILKKASRIFKKIKCSKKYKVLLCNLKKNKNIENFKKIIKPIIKITKKMQKYFNYDTNFSLRITLYDLDGVEFLNFKMIRFKNNNGYILFNPLYEKLFRVYIKKNHNEAYKNKMLFDCSFF